MNEIAYVAAILVLAPALAVAGWRMGRRRRTSGESSRPPARVSRADLPVGQVRPRVRSASYSRSERRK